jgi:dihydrofolate reductase
MRQVRYSVAASLDGYIADPDGGYDWIPEEPAIDFAAFLARIDTILMGRKTFEVARRDGGLASLPPIPIFVFSRTLDPSEVSGATLVREDVEGFVRELKEGEGKDLWLFGGGVLFGHLLDAGLVDLVEVAIVPVILGGGLPLLPVPGRVRLSLERTEAFPSGIVLNRYRVLDAPNGEGGMA